MFLCHRRQRSGYRPRRRVLPSSTWLAQPAPGQFGTLTVRLVTLKNRAEFGRVKNGGKWSAKSFVLLAMVRDGGESGGPVTARFGFTVASRSLAEKTAGTKGQPPKRPGAVMRNRAKRRLKEAVRLLAPVYARPEYDYVVIGRREALHQTFSDLLEDLRTAFGKVHRPPRGQNTAPRGRGARTASAVTGGTEAASRNKDADRQVPPSGDTGGGASAIKD